MDFDYEDNFLVMSSNCPPSGLHQLRREYWGNVYREADSGNNNNNNNNDNGDDNVMFPLSTTAMTMTMKTTTTLMHPFPIWLLLLCHPLTYPFPIPLLLLCRPSQLSLM
jgi:hypothetical protein